MVLYTKTDCPLCRVVKIKLGAAGIEYTNCTDEQKMEELNIDRLPVLILGDGTKLGFKEILNYIEGDKFNEN